MHVTKRNVYTMFSAEHVNYFFYKIDFKKYEIVISNQVRYNCRKNVPNFKVLKMITSAYFTMSPISIYCVKYDGIHLRHIYNIICYYSEW